MKQAIRYIYSDLTRYSGDVSLLSFVKMILISPGFRFQIIYRLAHENLLIGRILWIFRNKKIVINRKTEIGYGLYIGHGGPIVIHPTVKIGDNVNLSQFTTIGSNEGKAAEIGSCVYIGPNVCIIEHVIVGDNSTIGAGSVVTKDVPKNATVVGNYAKVINYNNPGKYIKNKWKL